MLISVSFSIVGFCSMERVMSAIRMMIDRIMYFVNDIRSVVFMMAYKLVTYVSGCFLKNQSVFSSFSGMVSSSFFLPNIFSRNPMIILSYFILFFNVFLVCFMRLLGGFKEKRVKRYSNQLFYLTQL